MIDRTLLKQDNFRMSRPQIMCATLKYHAVLEWAACDCSPIKFFLFYQSAEFYLRIFESGSRSGTYVATIATQSGCFATIATQIGFVATIATQNDYNLHDESPFRRSLLVVT